MAAGQDTPERLDAACAKAIAVGDPSYRTIKGILLAGTETLDISGQGPRGTQAPAFLHGPHALLQPADTETAHLATVVALTNPPDDTHEIYDNRRVGSLRR